MEFRSKILRFTLRKPEKFPGYVTILLSLYLLIIAALQFVCYLNMDGTKNFNGNFEHLFSLNEINISQTLTLLVKF